MHQGTVKWFSESKGFGFIEDQKGRNVFVHYSAISGTSSGVSEGVSVKFDLVETDRGPEASNVTVGLTEEH